MKTVVMAGIALLVGASVAGEGYENSSARMGNVRLKGRLGDCLDRMIAQHVEGTDVDYITAAFREKTERHYVWQTEFWGKWMHAAVPYARYGASARLMESVDRGIDTILSTQEPNGYIGNYPDELRCGEGWDVWGMKYTMMGLLHYYDFEREKGKGKSEKGQGKGDCVLAACRKLCDYLIAELGPGGRRGRELWQTGNWSGFASSSVLEPVMWLYKRTQDRKYLDFATYLVKGMREPETGPRLVDLALKGVSVADRNGHGNANVKGGAYVMKHNRWKSYEMMSCYQGLLEYYEVTKDADLLKAAVATAEDIIREEVNLAGGCASSEAWFHGAKKQHLSYVHLQETCVTTTWMRFCEKLLELTQDPKWADQIERTFYNAYLGALHPSGREFAAYTPLSGTRWHGMNHCAMHTDCCTSNGPRGFLCFLKEFFLTRDDKAVFNFYSSALVRAKVPATGKEAAFDMYSLYPRDNTARLVSHTEGDLELLLRIPAWSEKTAVSVNGKTLPDVKAGSYCSLKRTWKLGDVVYITFDMPVVAHRCDRNVAFTRGPVLLARDSRFADGDLMEPFRRGSIKDGQKLTTFADVASPSDEMWMTFTATLPVGAHTENPEAAKPLTVSFCDYASAGNLWRRDNFYRTWFPELRGPTE